MNFLIQSLNKIFPSDAKSGRLGSIEQIAWLAQCVGVPLLDFKPESNIFKAFITAYGIIILLLTEILYIGFEIYHLVSNWPSLDAFTNNASVTISHIVGTMKLLNTFWRLPDLHRAIAKLKTITTHFVVSKTQIKKFEEGEFENKLLLTIYATLIGLTAFAGICMLILYPHGIAGEHFPYCVKLPSWLSHKYQLSYMGISVLLFALQIVVIDFMNIALINHVRYHLEILMLSLEEINYDEGVLGCQQYLLRREIILRGSPTESLRCIIQHHCLLIQLRSEIQSIYNLPILLQFLTSLVVFGITGFRATVSGDATVDIIIFLYCGCLFIQLSFYCWYGNEVYEKSKALTHLSFGTMWYKCDKSFKTAFLLFLINTQRPFMFSGAGFLDLALPTFTSILSRSYTFIAVLRQFYSK